MTAAEDMRPVAGASPLVFSYTGIRPDPELLGWIADGLVSGVVVFGDNAPADHVLRESIAVLRRCAGKRPFRVMIDEEGGPVRRLADAAVSMRSLREYESAGPAAVADAYRGVARRLKALGVDTLLAPVVDVGDKGAAWLYPRTFSDDPEAVAAMARQTVAAVQREGVTCCAKHFPGLRGVAVDTHDGPADAGTPPSEWERVDAVPFRAAIGAGVGMVMVGHQRLVGFDAVRPACLSPLLVRVLLRERLGFAGVVATDDLAMGAIAGRYPIEAAVRAALDGGCSCVLVCRDRLLQRRALAAFRESLRRRAENNTP